MAHDENYLRESVLHRAVLSGDEQAWRTLYEESFDAVSRYVQWRCAGMTHLIEEVVQETWLTAVRWIRSFDPARGNFPTWVRGIAANLLRNQFRKSRSETNSGQDIDIETAISHPPEAALENREQAEQIAAALAALPGHYEQVLRAKYLDALPVDEIAACLRQSPKAVESLLNRARAALRKECAGREDLTH